MECKCYRDSYYAISFREQWQEKQAKYVQYKQNNWFFMIFVMHKGLNPPKKAKQRAHYTFSTEKKNNCVSDIVEMLVF